MVWAGVSPFEKWVKLVFLNVDSLWPLGPRAFLTMWTSHIVDLWALG